MKTLGDSLKNAREAKNLTQKEVAKRTGIHNKTISNYENDVSSPDPYTLKTFAEIYETSVDYLLGLSATPEDTNPDSRDNKRYQHFNISGLPEEAVRRVEEYIELLKLKYKADGKRKKK